MALSTESIDWLFERLLATYGTDFTRMYSGLSIAAVKSAWAHELQAQPLDAIAWALDNLPERPMNAIAFKNLCRRAPGPVFQALPLPKPEPKRVAAELGRLGQVRAAALATNAGGDPKSWADRLQAKMSFGHRPTLAVRNWLKELRES